MKCVSVYHCEAALKSLIQIVPTVPKVGIVLRNYIMGINLKRWSLEKVPLKAVPVPKMFENP